VSNFFGSVMFSILLVYAVRNLDLSPAEIGLVLTLGNIGFLVGAALSGRISTWLRVGPTMVAAAALVGWPLLLVPLAPRDVAAPVLIAAFGLASFAGVIYNVVGLSLMQAITPDRLLGRMNASRRFVVWGTIPLGSLTGGALASVIGLRETLFVGAIGASVAFVPVLFSPIRAVDRIPEELPEPA
jgi:MFS family permease